MLTEAQKKAAEMLWNGERIQDIAKAVGVHRCTVWRWRNSKEFWQEYRRINRNAQRRYRYRRQKEELREAEEREKRIVSAREKLQKETEKIHGKPHKAYWKAVDECEKAQFDGFTLSQILDVVFGGKRIRRLKRKR